MRTEIQLLSEAKGKLECVKYELSEQSSGVLGWNTKEHKEINETITRVCDDISMIMLKVDHIYRAAEDYGNKIKMAFSRMTK